MAHLTIKPRELPIIFLALILLALISEGYLDQHQWVIWLTTAATPTWIKQNELTCERSTSISVP